MILCCGEALIDMIPEATVSGGEGFVPHVGGAVFNTAVGLGRLGASVGLLSGISEDRFGAQLIARLEESHVVTDAVVRLDRPTTMAFVNLSGGHATYDFYDENTAGRMIAPENVAPIEDTVEALFFGGISLAVEPCADTYADVLAREGQSRAVMIDPNIRPGFIREEAAYRARLDKMLAQADVVKVSDEDLAWLMPDLAGMDARAAQLLAQGSAFVIVTCGSDGARGYLHAGDPIVVPAEKTEVVDTVGAGDTFNSGVLAKLSELGALSKTAVRALSAAQAEAAMAHGAKVAAVTVARAGANPPWASELG
ncbi:carbohydrate kinase family protein [Shimia sp. MMG029]|uniref:carbohydrate kinase family protein n=1 Tax=Shimia sp. MMG029 TaxID=3021978 RepID=UPI0022FEDB2C|nr:carbohydrate kinase [Shimia sp. MMG029]MDA5556976.1 carbohydrate kinase [Shimia sp. MMG029]